MQKLLTPIKSIKAEYIPLLAVYFAVGFTALTSVTNTFFIKNGLSLDTTQLISIAVWANLPWSIKMVFGSLIDGVPIFGSNRKGYIYLGNLLMALGMLGMVDHTSTKIIMSHVGEYLGLLSTSLLTVIGVVVSDIVADTMAIEVVKDGPTKEKELGMVQVLSRLALSAGSILAAAITGYLAATFQASTVFTIVLICPIISTVATYMTKLNGPEVLPKLNKTILFGGLAYGAICVLAGAFLGEYSQPVVFLVAATVISYMMFQLLKEMPQKAVKSFVLAMIAIFLFRTVPGIGPAGQWFYIEHLQFSEQFMGTLNLIAAVASFVVLYLLADSITNHSIFKTMLVLIVFVTILSLPDILIYYNIHSYLGIPAKSLVLADTAMIAPIGQLSMIPLGVLVAKNAPPQSRAIYISLTASLMNLALVAGDLITKELNRIFIVTRTDFTQLGKLMIWSLTISTILSIIGLVVIKRSKA